MARVGRTAGDADETDTEPTNVSPLTQRREQSYPVLGGKQWLYQKENESGRKNWKTDPWQSSKRWWQ